MICNSTVGATLSVARSLSHISDDREGRPYESKIISLIIKSNIQLKFNQ